MASMGVTAAVTEDQVAFYRENGFVQVDDVVSPATVAALREALDAAYRDDAGGIHTSARDSAYAKVLDQRVNVWRDHPVVREHVFDRRLAEMARRLAGVRGVRLWHDQALYKQPGDSKPTPWHQDLPYWPMAEPGALSLWLALDDVDEHNGAMSFVPGSQRVGLLPGINLVNPEDIFAKVPGGALAGVKPVLCRLRAGSCTFHDGRTFHAAGANHTAAPRRAMVTIYMPEGTTFNGKGHIVTDPLGLRPGQPLAGETFPVLAEA
jgi:ectoine hydroxylase-related dioxygenase (phytanoyl-CoA dioxygenase family)